MLVAACAALVGCGGDGDGGTIPSTDADVGSDGEAVYLTPFEDGNTFACATCHALEEPAADFRRPGHTLGDAANRPTY